MTDDNEIIILSCGECKEKKEGTFKELFGDISSVLEMGQMNCTCGGILSLNMTGRYKE